MAEEQVPQPLDPILDARPAMWRTVRWSPADLDRCEHGRHSIDSCFDCPGGQSSGNLFLDPLAMPKMRETHLDRNEFRIGTMVHGEPIFVQYRGEARE